MRIRLTVSYRGTYYSGWQVQPDVPSIQGELQAVAARLTQREVKVTGASRTDAGVHALGQVCHFDAPRSILTPQWMHALERLLPEDIRVVACEEVNADFHARFDARQKTYRYYIDPAPIASPFLSPFTWHRPRLTHFDAMLEATGHLNGKICQRVFASQPEGGRDIRIIDHFSVERDRLVVFTVKSRSFMRHAVRGMVGSLLEVGYGRRQPDEIGAMAETVQGHAPMVKAPPQGLFLVAVHYD
jgi:tRNA pseudouridine38-40 synthase